MSNQDAETSEEITHENTKKNDVSQEDVDKIIRKYMYGSFGVGLIPLPIVDVAGLALIQRQLIRELSSAYEVPFTKKDFKNILIPLISAAVPALIVPSLASLIKIIPIVGQTVGAVTMPVVTGGVTYATGQVFSQHFASGGTFLDFNVNAMKASYKDLFEKGKGIASKMNKETAGK